MAEGEWERLATAIIIPALQHAAAELNERDDIVAECCDYPFGDASVLWIARRMSPLPFLSPMGSFAIHDEPAGPASCRIEKTDPAVSGGRPLVCEHLSQSAMSTGSIKTRALAFAERVLSA